MSDEQTRRAQLQRQLRAMRSTLPRLVKVEVVTMSCEGTHAVDCFETLLERGYTPVIADGVAYYCLPPHYQDQMNQILPEVHLLLSQLAAYPLPDEQAIK
jgi:hypothetical protein